MGSKTCACLILKRGKVAKSEGIELPGGKTIEPIGILECDTIQHDEMKVKLKKEYFRCVRKVLGSKLNGGNIIRAINTWVVSLTLLRGIHCLETGRVKIDGQEDKENDDNEWRSAPKSSHI